MKIPRSFELGGFTWTVKLVKRLKGKYGDCDINTRTIRVKVMDTQLMEQTFCHEVMHAMEVAMNQQFRRAQKKGICSPLKEGRSL